MKAKTGLFSSTPQTLSKHLCANEISALRKLRVLEGTHVVHKQPQESHVFGTNGLRALRKQCFHVRDLEGLHGEEDA